MSVQAIYVSHLPNGITSVELRDELVKKCPEVFEEPLKNETLVIDVYVHKQNGTTATVKGFSFPFERLKLLFRKVKIQKGSYETDVNIKPDTGEPRQATGVYMTLKSPQFRRDISMLAGETHRKVTMIFPKSIRQSVNENVFTGFTSTSYLNSPEYDVNVLTKPGGIDYHFRQRSGYTKIRFHSILEQLQGIVYLNNNARLVPSLTKPAQFITEDGSERSNCSLQMGLGIDEEFIPIYELSLNTGYIPFNVFNSRFIDSNVKGQLSSKCWRCQKSYAIAGLTLELNSFTGTCECTYLQDQDRIVGPNKTPIRKEAYHWQTENFTRLILGLKKNATRNNIPLIINHSPIKTYYKGVEDYVATVMPLIEEEWYFTSSVFKDTNTTEGQVKWCQFLGYDNRDRKVYALRVLVSTASKVWAPSNPKHLKKLTFKITKNARAEYMKGSLFKIGEDTSATSLYVRAYMQIYVFDNGSPPEIKSWITIIPKPDKAEYKGMRNLLNKWVAQPKEKRNELRNILLDVTHKQQNRWMLPVNAIPHNPSLSGMLKLKTRRIFQHLNVKQQSALMNAENNRVSIVCGPPGTGKSVNLAAIIIHLCVHEDGGIVVCAPSNFAADGIAAAIKKLSATYKLDVPCLRIYSKFQEMKLIRTKNEGQSNIYDVLHEEIRKTEEWQHDKNLLEIANKLDSGEDYLVSPIDREKLQNLEKTLELHIMGKYKLFVSTVGALADKRVEKWNTQDDFITTVVLDEAGQYSQPGLINLFTLNPQRLVLGGDHKQLPPTVLSYAASVAGYDKSFMEICSWSYEISELNQLTNCKEKFLPPWTTLQEQYRMHKQIREIVSKLTYNNELEDARAIFERTTPIYLDFLVKRFDDHRVVVFDHCEPDLEIGFSFQNEWEAKIIAKFVDTLLTNGCPAEKITVLTFYEAQRNLISNRVQHKEIAVKNVDAYQGRENNVVILSLVRSNKKKDIGFLSSQNRLNVGISRAQHFLFIVMNRKFFQPVLIQHWKLLNKLLDENNYDIAHPRSSYLSRLGLK